MNCQSDRNSQSDTNNQSDRNSQSDTNNQSDRNSQSGVSFLTTGLFSETFSAVVEHCPALSAGRYQYHCNEQLLNINETWQTYQLDDGSILINSTRDAPDYGSTMWVQSIAMGGQINEFKVQWQQNSDNRVVTSEAHYVIDAQQTRVERVIHDQHSVAQRLITQHRLNRKNMIVSPLMRVYVGDTIKQLQSLGGTAKVMMPWIQDPSNQKRLLELQLSERSVVRIDNDDRNEAMTKLQCYNYRGDQYDDSALFWLNQQGLLERYSWQQNKLYWQVSLAKSKP